MTEHLDHGEKPPVEDAIATYRYLRVALVALVALLLVSTAITGLSMCCALPSISAYFYTVTHAVFIAALCAVGSCLIIYRGRTGTENTLLDFSGIMAFVVAFVPTGKPENPCGGGLPTPDNAYVGVCNNIVSTLVAALVGIGLYLTLRHYREQPSATQQGYGEQLTKQDRLEALGCLLALLKCSANILRWMERKLRWVILAILIAGLVIFIADRKQFDDYAHITAAVLMFAGIIGVAVLYGCYAAGERPTAHRFYSTVYLIIAGYMAAMVGVAFLLACIWPGFWTIVAEFMLIGGFAAFWVFQTWDVWNIATSPYSGDSLKILTGEEQS